jgi:hypothetical protein
LNWDGRQMHVVLWAEIAHLDTLSLDEL